MNRPICLLFLLSLAVLLVNSESTIEIDENGDEYDVKRFNIQGRQLNEGRSQCVEIRRKRATPSQPQPAYFDDASNNDNEDNTNESDVIKDDDKPPMMIYSPPVISSAADEEIDEDKKDEDSDINNMNIEGEEVTLSYMDIENDTKTEDDQDLEADKQKEKVDDGALEVVQLPQLPILGQLQSDGDSVAAITPAASVENEADTNGIIVIQSHRPPKVNPQTHAVFELVPVEDEVTETDNSEEDTNGEVDGGEFDFNEELSPISTSAIWSTGDDNSNDIYEDYDEKPLRVQKVKKPKKPLKNNKNTKKPAMKSKRKNKYNNSLRQDMSSSNKKPNKNKKRPNKTNGKRPNEMHKIRRGNSTRRRRPNKNKQTMIRTQNKNKNTKNSNKRHRNFNNRNRLIAKRNKNKKNAEVVNNGENTFTRTFTWTKTGNDDLDDKNVNCIIIRKDAPAPTTERPFWNLWGRSANGARQASEQFGLRKRANVRFVA